MAAASTNPTLVALRRLVHDPSASLEDIKSLIDAPGVNLALRVVRKDFLLEEDELTLPEERKATLSLISLSWKVYKDNILGWSATVGRLDVLKLLLQPPYSQNPHEEFQNPLFMASLTGHLAVVDHLVSLPGYQPNLKRPMSLNTPLSEAARANHLDIVRRLLDAGCDPRFPDNMPILRASASPTPNPEIIKLLVARGADVNAYGEPMRIAAENSDVGMINVLLDLGADHLEVAEDIERSAKSVDIVKLILDRGLEYPVDEDTDEEVRAYVESRNSTK
ncbi:hypothetical protein HDU96_004144 [Phlyctochytrium bullatum]|nr:hypothetical protein HDU96_004144 [Phlyctochytrium bullatum]